MSKAARAVVESAQKWPRGFQPAAELPRQPVSCCWKPSRLPPQTLHCFSGTNSSRCSTSEGVGVVAGATVPPSNEEKTAIYPMGSDRLSALTRAHGPPSRARCCELSRSVPLAWAGEEGALLSPSFLYLHSPGQMLNTCWCHLPSHFYLKGAEDKFTRLHEKFSLPLLVSTAHF